MTLDANPQHLLATARAFMESRILLTAAELDLFTVLADAPLTAAEVAGTLGAQLRPLTILLDALSSLGLLHKSEGCYRTDPAIAPLLSSSGPATILPMVLHSATMWKSWSELTPIVRETGGPRRPMGASRDPQELRAFIGAMHVVGAPVAEGIAAAIVPGEARSLLDIGGGPGTYTMALLRASPGLNATLFDRPAVVAMARENIAAAGLLQRVTFAAGDFYLDDLPGGHDLALLSAIIHQNSLEQNVGLYRKIHAALAPGGRLVIRDHIMQPDRTRPVAGAIFAINMLVATDGGGSYTFEEIAAGLRQSGFVRVRLLQQGERMDGLVEAYKDGG